MQWLAVGMGLAVVTFWGCGANLTPPRDAAGRLGVGGTGGHAGMPPGTEDAAWDGSASLDDAGRPGPDGGLGGAAGAGVPRGDRVADGGVVCPATTVTPGDAAGAGAVDAGGPDSRVARPAASWGDPTPLPFSCTPLPSTLFFPRPGADVPGTYARCASLASAGATALAVSPDGARVALIGSDGVARIVEVASHMVVGVLAPPRESISTAAFSPAGDTILTLAKGERVATAWHADTFAPIWSTALPGQTYYTETGATAFSPDGTTALVSPGTDLFLLDAATGAIRATRTSDRYNMVLGAAYGLGGQRIAVEDSPLTGAGTTCGVHPTGGTVTILDPASLTPIATPITLTPAGQIPFFAPGQLLVAAEADLMLIGLGPSSVPEAFRISDGGALPAPALTGPPSLLTPDGTAGLVASSGVLQLQRVTDGAVLSSVAATPAAVAISADGATIAAGASGLGLLSVWRPAAGLFAQTCFADPEQIWETSLSADGLTVAAASQTAVQVLRRTDGTLVSNISVGSDYEIERVQLSPDGAHALVEFDDRDAVGSIPAFPTMVFRTSNGAQEIDLTGKAPAGSSWQTFEFLPDSQTLFGLLTTNATAGGTLMSIELSTGALSPEVSFHGYIDFAGVSAGCPVVSSFSSWDAWRACGACDGPTFANGTSGGMISLDGRVYLSEQPDGTELWRILPSPALIRQYPARAEAATWGLTECPVAVTGAGDAVITTACSDAPCTSAPGFTCRIHDVATDQIVDDLPPGITSTSADLSVLAFGNVLWCAR